MASSKQSDPATIAVLPPRADSDEKTVADWTGLLKGLSKKHGRIVLLGDQADLGAWQKLLGSNDGMQWVPLEDIELPVIRHFSFKLLLNSLRFAAWARTNRPSAVISSCTDTRITYYMLANQSQLPWAMGNLVTIADNAVNTPVFTSKNLDSPHELLWETSLIRQLKESTKAIPPKLTSLSKKLEAKSRKQSKKRLPLVSVCVTHFNHGDFLFEQLDSLAAQTYSSFEVIIVDDASTHPQSRKAFKQATSRYSEQGWTFIENTRNGGVIKARKTCLNHAKGDWILFADADNRSCPRMIETFVHAALNSGWKAISSHSVVINREGEPIDFYAPSKIEPWLGAYVNLFGDNNAMVEARLLGQYIEKLNPSSDAMEDWELFFRMSMDSVPMGVVPEPLFEYRRHKDSISKLQPLGGVRRIRECLRELPFGSEEMQGFIDAAYLWMLAYEASEVKFEEAWESYRAAEKFWTEKETTWIKERSELQQSWQRQERAWQQERQEILDGNAGLSKQLESAISDHRQAEEFWAQKESAWQQERQEILDGCAELRKQLDSAMSDHRQADEFWAQKESAWQQERQKILDGYAELSKQLESAMSDHREGEQFWQQKESAWQQERNKILDGNAELEKQLTDTLMIHDQAVQRWHEKERAWVEERSILSATCKKYEGRLQDALTQQNELQGKTHRLRAAFASTRLQLLILTMINRHRSESLLVRIRNRKKIGRLKKLFTEISSIEE